MYGNFEVKTGTVGPGAPIVDVTREALLAAIEINGGDALAGFHQGDGDMQGGGGFTRSTLLVAQHNDVSRAGLTLTSLHQHASTPCDIFKFRATAVKLNAYSRTQIILQSVFMLNRTHHASRHRWLHDSASSYRGRLLLFECHLLGGTASALIRSASRHQGRRLRLTALTNRAPMSPSPLIVRTFPALRRALDG